MARRGQALVEFALILPLFLFVLLGGVQVGLALMVRYELVHAAIAGADSAARADCGAGMEAALAVLGRTPDRSSCVDRDELVTVSLGLDLPLLAPIGPRTWRIDVTERAHR